MSAIGPYRIAVEREEVKVIDIRDERVVGTWPDVHTAVAVGRCLNEEVVTSDLSNELFHARAERDRYRRVVEHVLTSRRASQALKRDVVAALWEEV